jgi:8-oxo-dGTP diphosphatase
LQHIARFLKRFPLVAAWVTLIWQLGRPRFTAGVVGVVFNDLGELLLVEHVFHPHTPWGLPGGWVDRNEALPVGLAREMREELELHVEVEQVVLVEIVPHRQNHIDIAFLCSAHNPVGKVSSELLGYQWTPLDALPSIPAFHQRAIERALTLRT